MLWLLVPLLLSAPAAPVDRIAVVVGDELILESDFALEEELAKLDISPSPFWSQRWGSASERLVDATVIRIAAGDVKLYQPTDDEVGSRLEAVRLQFETRARWTTFLERWGLNETSLKALLRRRIIVERYLSRNLQSGDDLGAWQREAKALVRALTERQRVRAVAPQ